MKTIRTTQSTAGNENGYVMVAVLLFIVVLSVIGIASNHTSTIEVEIAGNERSATDDFLQTEGELNNDLEDNGAWLNDDVFLITALDEANYTAEQDEDSDGNPEYNLEVRCIENISDEDAEGIEGLSTYANDVPRYDHTGPPPPNYAYSVVNFYVRRFAVTERSANNRTILQAGVWKAFPASNED